MIGRRALVKGVPAMFGLGKTTPSRFPYPDRPTSGPGIGPSQGQVVRAATVIVFGPAGKFTGVFVYSGTPALGNLVESLTFASGTDPYGNPYAAGFASYDTSSGLLATLNTAGLTWTTTSGHAITLGYNRVSNDIELTSAGATMLASTPDGALFIGNNLYAWLGPSGDTSGATDTPKINGLLAAGCVVNLMAGTFYVNAPIIIASSNVLRGAGRQATVIQLAAAVNGPILQSKDFATLTGSGSNTQGAGEFEVRGLVLDGNQAGQTVPAAAAVQIFGFDYVFDDVSIRNFLAVDGLYTEFGLLGQPGPEGAMESRFALLRIHGNTLTGAAWHNRGPHDSEVFGCFIYQNTTAATGFFAETGPLWSGSAFLIFGMHVWGSHAIAYNLATQTQLFNCTAEGATNGQVLITGSDCGWFGGQVFASTSGTASYGFQVGTVSTAAAGLTLQGPHILNFAGTSAATAAISFVNVSAGWFAALITQPSGQAIWGTVPVGSQRRFSYTQTDVPALTALAGLGTGPPAPALSNASGNRGVISLGTGAAPSAGSAVSAAFGQPKAGTPAISVWPENQATAALQPYVLSPGATGFTVGFAVAPAAGQGAGTYLVGYADVT